MPLIKICKPVFNVELEIAYASANNFTGKPVYKNADCFLHPKAAELLQNSIKLAAAIGLSLKIFDGFRPTEAQWILWEHTPDPNFLAHPAKGSAHSRGVAVDLTLLDSEGKELDMGTKFDEFSEKSFHSNTEIPKHAQINRKILLGIMTAAGWDYYENEWWHYQLFLPRAYRLYSSADLGLYS